MDIEKVVEEIISSAQKEAEKIEKEGEKEAERILSEAKEKAKEIKEKKLEEARKIVEEMKKREEALAKLQGRKAVMERRKEIIEEILSEVRERFMNLEESKRKKVIEALAKKTGRDWAVVHASKRDFGLIKQMFKNSQVKESHIPGGFVVENEDGSVRMDMSFEAVFENMKKELVKTVIQLGEKT